MPIHIDYIAGWWMIASQKDWLLAPDGSESLAHFRHIGRFPEAGREACHSEILVAAFAQLAITWSATGGMTWITEDMRERSIVPEDFLRRTQTVQARVIAFTTREDD